jgi:hypothetical protein
VQGIGQRSHGEGPICESSTTTREIWEVSMSQQRSRDKQAKSFDNDETYFLKVAREGHFISF